MVCESTRPRVPLETIVCSVPSMLSQGTATTRKLFDDNCSRQYRKNIDQQVADEKTVRSQSRREVVQEIAQLSSGQDAKTNDHVGRIQCTRQFGCEIA